MELGNTSVRLVKTAASSAPQSPISGSYGLKSASLSPSETLAQSVALIAPTGAPVMTVPLVFGLAGQGCAMAFLISTVGILLVALNVNQFARISASPGSLYTYITNHMHPRWGVLAGWALLIAYIGTAAAVSLGVTNYANVILLDRFGVQAFPLLLVAIVMVGSCYLAYRDVQISTRLMLWLEALSVALISLLAVSVIAKHGWRVDLGQITLQGVTPQKLRLGLVLAIFSSVGFESARITGNAAGHLWIYGFGTAMSNQASYLRYDGQRWSMTHDVPAARENRAIVRGVAVIPGTRAVWSVGVGILSAAPHGRARIELYGTIGQ